MVIHPVQTAQKYNLSSVTAALPITGPTKLPTTGPWKIAKPNNFYYLFGSHSATTRIQIKYCSHMIYHGNQIITRQM